MNIPSSSSPINFRERMSDVEFVERAKQCEPLARGMLQKAGFQHADIDDALQMAYFSAFQQLQSLRDPTHFDNWFITIAYRMRTRLLRRNKHMISLSSLVTPADSPAGIGEKIFDVEDSIPQPDIICLQREAQQQIQLIMRDNLKETHSRTIEQYHWHGMSYAEIAKADNVPEGTVKKRLYHGRRRLGIIFRERGLAPAA